MFQNKIKIADNFMDFVPVRKVDFGQDENGKIYLLREKTKNRIMKKLIASFGKSQYFHVHLDQLGTLAWSTIDGKSSVYEICEKMKKEHDVGLEHLEQRLCLFLSMLKQGNFIDFI